MEFITRYKNALFLIAVLLVQAIALAMQVPAPVNSGEPDGHRVLLIREWATSTVTPLERAAHTIGYGMHHGWAAYIDLRHVRQQNQDLQQQLTRMRIEQAAIVEDAVQGRRLQALLAFREQYVGSTVAAQIIGASGSDQSRVLTIDKGSRSGLKPDMAVITQDGIVGKLRDVFPSTAQVLEINDQSSGAGVILESTRIRAILRGRLAHQARRACADLRRRPGLSARTARGHHREHRARPRPPALHRHRCASSRRSEPRRRGAGHHRHPAEPATSRPAGPDYCGSPTCSRPERRATPRHP